MGHIELGKWADLVILAPATADLIALLLPEWRMTWYRRFVWLHLRL
ncbi:hypothetical protein ACNKHV_22905 [Shigella flexneri]